MMQWECDEAGWLDCWLLVAARVGGGHHPSFEFSFWLWLSICCCVMGLACLWHFHLSSDEALLLMTP
jgi:hypothetical protein